MENIQHYREEMGKCPFHSQQNNQNSNSSDKEDKGKPDKPDEAGTDPKRYQPDKFRKGSDERSGGDGTAKSAAEQLEKRNSEGTSDQHE